MARKKFGILHQNTKIRQKCLEYDFFPSQNTYFCWSWVRFLFSRGCRSFNNPTTFFMSGHSSHVWLMPRSHLRVHWCLTEHPDYTHLIPSLLNVGGWDRDRLALSRGATFHAWGNYQPSCVSHCFSIIYVTHRHLYELNCWLDHLGVHWCLTMLAALHSQVIQTLSFSAYAISLKETG